jgi:hypothetical protein
MDDATFDRIYGAWDPPTLPRLQAAFAGFDRPWWVCGGWAIELAGGVARPHHDLDVLILLDDLPRLRRHLAGWQFVQVQAAMEPVILGPDDPLPPDVLQLWIRRDAAGPWLIDLGLARTVGDQWCYKRDESFRLPVADIGLLSAEGIPYLRPELALLFKAKLARPQDEDDFIAVLSRLDAAAQQRLRDYLVRFHPQVAWLRRLDR